MKVKLLKKIRKRYSSKFLLNTNSWQVLDHKNKSVFYHSELRGFIEYWISNHVGVYSCIAYMAKKQKIWQLKQYKNELSRRNNQ